MKEFISTQERNKYIIDIYKSNQVKNMTTIARMFNVSRQRVSKILAKYKATRNCSNCFYYQEFKHCSCKDEQDVVKGDNKCQDWLPV